LPAAPPKTSCPAKQPGDAMKLTLQNVCAQLKAEAHVTFRISPTSRCTVKDLTNSAKANDPSPRRSIKASFRDYMKKGAKFYELIFEIERRRVRMVVDTANIETIISKLLNRQMPPTDEVIYFARGTRSCWFEHETKARTNDVVTPFLTAIVNGASLPSVALLSRDREFL
jgi:hypothetical protein